MPRLRQIVPHLLATCFPNEVLDAAHMMLYRFPQTHESKTYLGCPVDQLAMDLWLYQEIIFRERPPFILQTGVDKGGSILYFATLLDLIGARDDAIVIGVDLRLSSIALSLSHDRIRLIEGNSIDAVVLEKIRSLLPDEHGLISLDSDHSKSHVLKELEVFSRFTKPGCHLFVEDTNINGHPVYSGFGEGPMEAVDEFIVRDKKFVRDEAIWRRNLISFHNSGWLLRKE
jgi:cephalosporin hydroxylase